MRNRRAAREARGVRWARAARTAPRRGMSEPDSLTEIAEEVSRRVVELLEQRPAPTPWLAPAEVAKLLAVTPDYIYAHASELGARRLGDGPKARRRFRLRDGRHDEGREGLARDAGRLHEAPPTP